jgi:hypothetical protein
MMDVTSEWNLIISSSGIYMRDVILKCERIICGFYLFTLMLSRNNVYITLYLCLGYTLGFTILLFET